MVPPANYDVSDIKDDNILVTIENKAVLADFVRLQKKNPQVCHKRPEDGRITYLSQDDFGPLQGSSILPKLADFNLAVPGLPGGLGHVFAIQSHRFRAPEVLLGCAWSYSADIWNFGLFVSTFPELPNRDTNTDSCGTSWKTSACSTGLLARMANTTHTSTLRRWLLSSEIPRRNSSKGSDSFANSI